MGCWWRCGSGGTGEIGYACTLQNDALTGKGHFLAYLTAQVPAGLLHGERDVLGADVGLGEGFLLHTFR